MVTVPPRHRWVAVALVAGAILVVSMIPIPGSVPADSGGIPTSVLFHFVGYATLAAVFASTRPVRESRVRANAITFVAAGGYGALIECLQYQIPYRSFSYLDMLVNGAGATLGVLVLTVLVLSEEYR